MEGEADVCENYAGRRSRRQRLTWLRKVAGSTSVGRYLLEKYDDYKLTGPGSGSDDGRAAMGGRGGEGDEEGEGGVGGGSGGAGRKVTEKQLVRLGEKIDKLLSRLDDKEKVEEDVNVSKDEECVICLSARATMRTYPCRHKVVCRKCFIRTIQVAISQRNLPLRCPVCRSRILKLSDDPPAPAPATSCGTHTASHHQQNRRSSQHGSSKLQQDFSGHCLNSPMETFSHLGRSQAARYQRSPELKKVETSSVGAANSFVGQRQNGRSGNINSRAAGKVPNGKACYAGVQHRPKTNGVSSEGGLKLMASAQLLRTKFRLHFS